MSKFSASNPPQETTENRYRVNIGRGGGPVGFSLSGSRCDSRCPNRDFRSAPNTAGKSTFDQIGPSWSKVLFQEGETQQN